MINVNSITAWEYAAERKLKDRMAWINSYRRGYQEAHYSIPSTIVCSAEDYFAAYYAIELLREIFREGL